MFGVQFYPTPPWLVRRLLAPVDFSRVTYALEPSAGKGDLAQALKKGGKVDCVEIDPDLRSVLSGRGFDVVGNDFLQFETHTRYDLICMNPPFSEGDKHLLHALHLLRHGGQLACILNQQTLQNPCTNSRKELLQRLNELDARVEIVADSFADAERTAEVDVALVYAEIPQKEEGALLHDLELANDTAYGAAEYADSQLAENDIFRVLVQQFERECSAGLRLLDCYRQLRKYIPLDEKERNALLVVAAPEEEGFSSENSYLRTLRRKYWANVFGLKQMQGLFTREIREGHFRQLDKFRCYDFTMNNLLQLRLDLSKTMTQSMDAAILKMFDSLTYDNSMEKNGNIHYYNGWKTNRACRVGQKVIFRAYGLYESRWGGSWSVYKATDTLAELEKVCNYLDRGRTDGVNCDELVQAVFRSEAKNYAGEWIPCKFFEVSLKKKCTVHVRFTDEVVLKKFNLFGANKRGWLPPCYGKKAYRDMDAEEKAVVHSFEGEKAYAETMQNAAFYLSGGLLELGAG